jgi:cyclopropane-fatty-acyl-phospholipid synthase
MSFIAATIDAFEGAPLPDLVRKTAIELLVANARRQHAAAAPGAEARFAAEMDAHPIAEHTDAANAQHYELPAPFFQLCLGRQLKYSSCLYPTPATTLDEAEEHALAETAAHAGLADGQRILELGCGWGSLSLWMAKSYPAARITAVSNSASQRAFILARAQERGLGNLEVVTCDMNVFDTDERFDRIVSVEMFEHMANWRGLLAKARGWVKPDGRLFVHVFTHRTTPYRFDLNDEADWIGKYFFSGGVMPSHGLIGHFPDLFTLEQDWRWSGLHYQRTALDWLANYDRNLPQIRPVLEEVYGRDATLWHRRWRLFYLATAGLFGHRGGNEWGVSHYRLKPA